MDHDSTVLTVTFLSVCSFTCFATAVHVITCYSPGTVQLTISSHDSASHESTRTSQQKHQTLVCHKPLCQLSVINQSDTTETLGSCVDQDFVSAADCISVFQARLSGEKVLELLMSPKGSVVAPVPTTVARRRNHHKRRLTVPAGITRPKLQQPCSRPCVPKPLPPQNPLVSTTPVEILAEGAIRTIHADGGEEESETVTEHEDSDQDVAPRPGAVSC